jgi:hypothetical protein
MPIPEQLRMLADGVAGLGDDAFHIHLGLAVLLLVVIVFRRSPADWRPLAAVAAIAVAAPVWTMIDRWSHGGGLQWTADWRDVGQILFWPAVLFVLARFTRVLKR